MKQTRDDENIPLVKQTKDNANVIPLVKYTKDDENVISLVKKI